MTKQILIGSIVLLVITAAAVVYHFLPNKNIITYNSSLTAQHETLSPEQKFLLHGPVDINKASIEELEAIPHIGPSLARRIYDYINQNDRISNINELLEIKGVGPNNIKRIAKYIYIAKPEK